MGIKGAQHQSSQSVISLNRPLLMAPELHYNHLVR